MRFHIARSLFAEHHGSAPFGTGERDIEPPAHGFIELRPVGFGEQHRPAAPCCIEKAMDKDINPEDAQFLAEVAAESIGWLPLADGAYLHLHLCKQDEEEVIITVIGVPDTGMVGMSVLWVG